MSDEEITCQGSSGNDLYAYLLDQGYSDFETFTPSSSENKVCIDNSDFEKKEHVFNSTNRSDSNVPILIGANDHKTLLNILHSQLLFKEDVDLIEAFMSNVSVYESRSNLLLYISAAASFLTSTFLLKNRISIYFSCSVTTFLSLYSAWKCYREFKDSCNIKATLSHVSMLQKLCSNIHKLLRFLRETEILSTNKVSIHNVGAATYMPLPALVVDELNGLPAWKTLPHLRRCLVDSLVETVNILSFACDDLRHISPSWIHETGNVTQKVISQCINKLIDSDQCLLIKQIQSLNDTYLVVQSEYLRWIAVNLSPVMWGISIKQKESTQKAVLKLISQVQLKLNNISFKLMMHYKIHNISSTMNKTLHQTSFKNHLEKIKHIQVEVHNIFLLIFSILSRVRSLEDYIENISDISENQNNLDINLTKELFILKEDLIHALKCYDTIINQTISGTKVTIPKQISPTDDSIRTKADLESKPTAIRVGMSDFSVNSADEVFLAVSGLKTEDQEGFIDDWCLDKKAQIPNSLLVELSNTLKSRKKDFHERERKALERQGLQDIGDESDAAVVEESDQEVLPCKNVYLKKTNIKRNKRGERLMNSNLSSSKSEQFEHERRVLTEKLSKCKKQQRVLDSENSTSEDEVSNLDVPLGETFFDRPINSTSIANLIAMKSQLWGKTSEECYSDG